MRSLPVFLNLASRPTGGGPWREHHPARQPDVVGVAVRALPVSPGLICRSGAMADCVPAGVLRLGGGGGYRVPTSVRVSLKPGDFHERADLITLPWIVIALATGVSGPIALRARAGPVLRIPAKLRGRAREAEHVR
jgi:hypothetical protein